MHESKLQNGGEDEPERHEDEKVQGSGVGNFWQIGTRLEAKESHCEHGGDAERDPIRGRLSVEPERHPGQDDEQDARPIDLDQEITHVTLQVETHDQHGILVLDCGRGRREWGEDEEEDVSSCLQICLWTTISLQSVTHR